MPPISSVASSRHSESSEASQAPADPRIARLAEERFNQDLIRAAELTDCKRLGELCIGPETRVNQDILDRAFDVIFRSSIPRGGLFNAAQQDFIGILLSSSRNISSVYFKSLMLELSRSGNLDQMIFLMRTTKIKLSEELLNRICLIAANEGHLRILQRFIWSEIDPETIAFCLENAVDKQHFLIVEFLQPRFNLIKPEALFYNWMKAMEKPNEEIQRLIFQAISKFEGNDLERVVVLCAEMNLEGFLETLLKPTTVLREEVKESAISRTSNPIGDGPVSSAVNSSGLFSPVHSSSPSGSPEEQ